MNDAHLEELVHALLYEGHILYPYRPTSRKNQRARFTFGRVYPERYSLAQNGAEPCVMQTECLLAAGPEAVLNVTIRFLQPVLREIGELLEPISEWNGSEPKLRLVPEMVVGDQLLQTWHEAAEQRIDVPLLTLKPELNGECRREHPFAFEAVRKLKPIHRASGQVVGFFIRSQAALSGTIEVSARALGAGTFKLTVRVFNQTTMTRAEVLSPDAVLVRTLASTHTLLSVEGGEFVSLMDPPAAFRAAAATCKNTGTWPVLVGDETKGERTTILSSPIILYDYPKISPESAGSLFDGTEIDEILTLRLKTLTDAEKIEMRHVDEHARRVLERTEHLPESAWLQMHGVMKPTSDAVPVEFDDFFGANSRLESVTVAGALLKAGDRVRIRPKARADVMDMALAGQVAVVEAVEQDMEKHVHLAVVLENDPGKDLGMMRQPGHRFFYSVDEVEPLVEEPL
jgi:hypothetical protein